MSREDIARLEEWFRSLERCLKSHLADHKALDQYVRDNHEILKRQIEELSRENYEMRQAMARMEGGIEAIKWLLTRGLGAGGLIALGSITFQVVRHAFGV